MGAELWEEYENALEKDKSTPIPLAGVIIHAGLLNGGKLNSLIRNRK